MEKAKVYFTKDLSPEGVVRLYKAMGKELDGKTAVKIHSGEPGNQNFMRPEFWKPVKDEVEGTFVEANTAYDGGRQFTEDHKKSLQQHGWVHDMEVEILDEDGELELPVKNGHHLDKNIVGKGIDDYDSVLVLTHFKGHPMGGYGGALKNISIGIASTYGKKYIHGVKDVDAFWTSDHDSFLESMADAASTITDKFKDNIAYINVMKNMSVDCDCCAVAEDPAIGDIGVLASTDPVAIDQACLDLVYASEDPGRDHLLERIESRNGVHTIEAAAELGVGNREYELIDIDEKQN